MKKNRKQLEDAFVHVDSLPNSFFGSTSFSIEDLPSVKNKQDKIKKTYVFKRSVIEKIEKLAKKHNVSVGDLISDILEKI